MTYTVGGNTITFTVGTMSFTLTFNDSNQTLKGEYIDEDAYETYSVESASFTEFNETSSSNPFVGTWNGKIGNLQIEELIINEDGTASMNGEEIEIAIDGDVLTFTYGTLSITLTYDEASGTIDGHSFDEDMYEDYYGELVKS